MDCPDLPDPPHSAWYFSAQLRDRHSRLLVEHADILRRAFRITRQTRPFVLNAIVVLPDQLHGVWTLPGEDDDGERRWRQIQAVFDRQLPGLPPRALLRRNRCARPLWHDTFRQHRIVGVRALERKVAYVHQSPVRHGHVREPTQWPYSSIHRPGCGAGAKA